MVLNALRTRALMPTNAALSARLIAPPPAGTLKRGMFNHHILRRCLG